MTRLNPSARSPTRVLADEFRCRLETFYAELKLAPPYESVEKALRALTTAIHALPSTEQERIVSDPALQWEYFRQAFDTSGLAKKHRGIIAGLARNRSRINLSADYDQFLNLFSE